MSPVCDSTYRHHNYYFCVSKINFAHPTRMVPPEASTIRYVERTYNLLLRSDMLHKSSSNLSTNPKSSP